MNRYLFILILVGVPLLAQDQGAQKPPASKEAAKPAPKPAPQSKQATQPVTKSDPPPVSPRTRHPFGRPPVQASARTEYAKPSISPALSRPPVVWEKSWASPINVEWEDAPMRMAPVVAPADQPAKLAEDIIEIKKQLDELTQMVRTLAEAQATRE